MGDIRPWRTGRKVGRTVYRQRGADPADGDELIGLMDTRDLAALVVDAVNGVPTLMVGPRPGPCPSVCPFLVPEAKPPIRCDLDAGHAGDHVGGEHRTRWTNVAQDVAGTEALREHMAQALEAYAGNYPTDIWPEDSQHPEALAARAMRHAYRNAARIVREAPFPARDHEEGHRG